MAYIFRNGMILIFTVPILVAVACGAPISQVDETQGTDSRKRCLQNQELSDDLTCRNCTYCYPGTEHSPTTDESCVTTCRPCEKGQYQPREGYRGLKCHTCVSCLQAVELKTCTPSQNTECGECLKGYFKFQPNTCLDCTDQPTHSNCQEPAQGNYTATPPQPTAPAEPVPPSFESTLPHEKNAPVSTPESPSPQSPNVTKDPGDSGKPRRKFSLTDILISVIVTVIVICITVRLWYACKKRGLVCSTSSSTLEIKSYLEVATDDKTGSACSSPLASGSRSFCGPSTSDPQLVYDPFQGAGVPVGLTLDPQSSDVTNKDASLPGLLRSNGGPGGDQEVYQNQHRSLELERDDLADYFSEGPAASAATAADDDGDGDDDANAEDDSSDPISQPLPLMP